MAAQSLRHFAAGALVLAFSTGIAAIARTARAELRATKAPALTVECDDLELAPLADALDQEIAQLGRRSGALKIGERSVPVAEYIARTLKPLAEFARAGDRTKLCGQLLYRMSWYQLDSPILFTAYHTPSVRGSLTADDTYRYPLYRRPKGPAANYTTAQILAGALRGWELVWLADPYDALALHIEGAGIIQLPDGRLYPVGSDGHNGHPYQNVSKLLAADGKLPQGAPPPSNQPGNPKARHYFAQHAEELPVYWGKNPHFVYFKAVAKAGGGKLGALTPGRSIAIDESRVPMGALMYVRAQKPVVTNGAVTGWTPMGRVVLGQDTGAGIKGARIDVYFGEDDYALAAAQAMSVQGDAWVLLAN
ncbi:MAG TPA: MltA domain-containing protein [Polyangia bacterium]|nr:MltA domain-containing protein [Polyangia bacterium]